MLRVHAVLLLEGVEEVVPALALVSEGGRGVDLVERRGQRERRLVGHCFSTSVVVAEREERWKGPGRVEQKSEPGFGESALVDDNHQVGPRPARNVSLCFDPPPNACLHTA